MVDNCKWNPSKHNGESCPTHEGGGNGKKKYTKKELFDKFGTDNIDIINAGREEPVELEDAFDDDYDEEFEATPDNIRKRGNQILDEFNMPEEEGWKLSNFGEKSFVKNEGTDNEVFIQYNGSDYDGSNQEYVAGYIKNGEYVTEKFDNLDDAKDFVNNAPVRNQSISMTKARGEYNDGFGSRFDNERNDNIKYDFSNIDSSEEQWNNFKNELKNNGIELKSSGDNLYLSGNLNKFRKVLKKIGYPLSNVKKANNKEKEEYFGE